MLITGASALLWLALNVHHEARGEPYVCQVMAAEVTLRRVQSPYYPNTVREVVTEHKQFSWFNGRKEEELDFSVVSAMDLSVAVDAFSSMSYGWTFTSTELHYARNDVINYWTQKMEKTIICGNHTFYDNGGLK